MARSDCCYLRARKYDKIYSASSNPFDSDISLQNNFPEIFRSQYREGKPFVDTFFTNISKSLGSLTRSWAGFEEISAKLSSISMNGIKRQYPMYEPNDREIFVLSHSDMWTNNLFYKYDNDHNVADVMLVSGNFLLILRSTILQLFSQFSD